MAKRWSTPIYKLRSITGKEITIDVTKSISKGLGPHEAVETYLVSCYQAYGANSILDFGAGVFRHSKSLVSQGIDVCAVEFREAFESGIGAEVYNGLHDLANFRGLIWPHDFEKDDGTFGVALLSYVLEVMPIPEERAEVVKLIRRKLEEPGLLLFIARHGQLSGVKKSQSVNDGYYMYPTHGVHTFLTQKSAGDWHRFFEKQGFVRTRSLSRKGQEHVFVYQLKKFMSKKFFI